MKKVAEVLLSAFLRRYPLPTRVSLFGFLGRYAWLKDILEELRPELFPPRPDALVAATAEQVSPELDGRVLGILERSQIRGRLGYYKAERYLGERGNGHLFSAIETTAKRPVIIKEFILSESNFTKAEALHRQSNFQRLAGIQLADGRLPEFRVIQPLEAIADTESQALCFLVTPDSDRSPTLRQHLQTVGALPPEQVREVLSQILQTLDFLHNHKFNFPSGALQPGLIHGNLSLDSVLWTEQLGQPFVYLTDLLLWEQCFEPSVQSGRSTQPTADLIQQDLRALGDIGFALLQGLNPPPPEPHPPTPPRVKPPLPLMLDHLRTGKFASAETARRELLQLATRSPTALIPVAATTPPAPATRPWSPLLLLSLLGLLVGALVLLPRLRSTASRSAPAARVATTCCLAEVSAVPAGEFTYTAVPRGTWWTVLQQQNLLQRGQSLTSALELAQPKLQLRYVPPTSAPTTSTDTTTSTTIFDSVLAQVRSGAADFAVLPAIAQLPGEFLAQPIAYDGLATVVSFSYANRSQGLPAALRGQLSLVQVQQLFKGQLNEWQKIGGPPLPVQRYAANNPEAIAIFEQQVLNSKLSLSLVKPLPSLELLRQVIRDFEDKNIGSIGVTPLSEMWGQCSVYPLALSEAGQAAVQPLVLSNGQEIIPETDLCDRKGAFAPDPDRFHTDSYILNYPISYPIVVVYPRDNRRSAIGKKFVELMRTIEGQKLLRAAGLVPLNSQLPYQAPTASKR